MSLGRAGYDWSYHGIGPLTSADQRAHIVVEEASFGPTERISVAVLRELSEPPSGGFGWGYNGGGTSRAAAVVLADAFGLGELRGIYGGREDPTLVRLRESFCWDVLAEMCDEWRLRRGAVLRWAPRRPSWTMCPRR